MRTCSLGGDSSSQVACTGVTGNVFEGSTCSNNAAYNSDQSACKIRLILLLVYLRPVNVKIRMVLFL